MLLNFLHRALRLLLTYRLFRVYSFFLILISAFVLIVAFLSTFGVETAKFNNIVIKEIKKKDLDDKKN